MAIGKIVRSSVVREADSMVCLSGDPSTKVLGYFHSVRFADEESFSLFGQNRTTPGDLFPPRCNLSLRIAPVGHPDQRQNLDAYVRLSWL
jgi:hypothetical protein